MATNPELQELEDQIQRQQWSKWLCYQRLTIGMTDESEKIAVALKVRKMPEFGVFQCWSEHLAEKQRNPRKSELELLVEQLQEEPVKLLCYRRRSLGLKSEKERIEVAKQVAAMQPFNRAQEKFEHLWAERHAAGVPGAN